MKAEKNKKIITKINTRHRESQANGLNKNGKEAPPLITSEQFYSGIFPLQISTTIIIISLK
jgi:hypothetical protein